MTITSNKIAEMLNIPAIDGTYIFDLDEGPRAFEYHSDRRNEHGTAEGIYAADAKHGQSNSCFSVTTYAKAPEQHFRQRFGVDTNRLATAAVYRLKGSTHLSAFANSRDDSEKFEVIREAAK